MKANRVKGSAPLYRRTSEKLDVSLIRPIRLQIETTILPDGLIGLKVDDVG